MLLLLWLLLLLLGRIACRAQDTRTENERVAPGRPRGAVGAGEKGVEPASRNPGVSLYPTTGMLSTHKSV